MPWSLSFRETEGWGKLIEQRAAALGLSEAEFLRQIIRTYLSRTKVLEIPVDVWEDAELLLKSKKRQENLTAERKKEKND